MVGRQTPAVVVSFELTRDEVQSAMGWTISRFRTVRWSPYVGSALLVAAVVDFGVGGSLLVAGVFLLVGIYGFWIRYSAIHRGRRFAYRFTTVRLPHRVVFDETGMQVSHPRNSYRRSWDRVPGVTVHDGFYLIQNLRNGGTFPVPRRAFASSEDESAFRVLVQEHTRLVPID